MIFKHPVKYNGVYYPTGTDVPVGVKPVVDKKPVEVEEEKYTKTDINRMSTADLKKLAKENGLNESMSGAEIKKALIDKFEL